MRILCANSGIEFTATHFTNLILDEKQEVHPVFSLDTKSLLNLAPKFLAGELSATENYLYYLSLFNSSGLVEFHTAASYTSSTQQIIAQNCAPLIRFTEILHNIGHESARQNLELPKFAITLDTRDLAGTKYWIQLWLDNYQDWQNRYKSRTLAQKLLQHESVLEKYLKDHSSDPRKFASRVADWAADAAGFAGDTYLVADGTENDKPIPFNEYWKKLIRMCVSEERIYAIHEGDISELIDHCEETIDHGSIHAHFLMSKLRGALKLKKTAFDLGDFDLARNKLINGPGATFSILEDETNILASNIQTMIDGAPLTEPKLIDYPNRISWLKAKAKWQLAQQFSKPAPQQPDLPEL